MFHYNLEKSSSRNVYFVRAVIDTVLLSNSENFIFTGSRINLPNSRWTDAKLRASTSSAFITNSEIVVPEATVRSSPNNLVVRLFNKGPLDIYVKRKDIVAEVCLYPENGNWKLESRRPDLKDFFIFGSLCERLRIAVAHRRQAISRPIVSDNFAQDILPFPFVLEDCDCESLLNDTYTAALAGVSCLVDRKDIDLKTNEPDKLTKEFLSIPESASLAPDNFISKRGRVRRTVQLFDSESDTEYDSDKSQPSQPVPKRDKPLNL